VDLKSNLLAIWPFLANNAFSARGGTERAMRCVANFEVRSDVSVVADDIVLTINDPRGAFKARLKNIPRSEYTTPFLLSLHIYFEAPDLDQAKETSQGLLASCLNMLAFSTGARFRKQRIRQIVDADEPLTKTMRDAFIWADKIEYEDPQPFLRAENAQSIERLLDYALPPAIARALRWYRLGIDATSPDDQFTYFWFALEIVAEFQKPTEKVHDKCPHCQSALYCEKCKKHPKHKPYAKQAIRALMKAADQKCDDATVNLLDKTRNSLMHGSTLREIESALPDPHESIVDTLGRLLFRALIKQFPKEMFDGTLLMGMRSTFVHYEASAFARIQTIVPVDEDGHFNLDFVGMKVELKPDGPPQSAVPTIIKMTPEQYDRLAKLRYEKGEHQEMVKRIWESAKEKGGHIYVRVFATDMSRVRQELKANKEGKLQEVLRELFEPIDGDDAR
jgi:hypothetical protein